MSRSIPFAMVLIAVSVGWALRPETGSAIPLEKPAPEIAGEQWLNSKPLTIKALRGRVVLVEFWTYG